MGESMSYLSINNSVAVRDEYRQIASGPARAMSNSPTIINAGVNSHLSRIDEGRGGSGETAGTPLILTKLLEMFTQFFTQLQSLLSGTRTNVTPDRVPAPQPRVMPMPELPLPDSRTSHLPDLSHKRNGAKPDDIWGGFRQGPDGNCVTISAIKAAMHRFGQSPTDIYQHVTRLSGGYRVVMRDDFQLTLTDRELAEGARGAKFRGQDKGMLKRSEERRVGKECR